MCPTKQPVKGGGGRGGLLLSTRGVVATFSSGPSLDVGLIGKIPLPHYN